MKEGEVVPALVFVRRNLERQGRGPDAICYSCHSHCDCHHPKASTSKRSWVQVSCPSSILALPRAPSLESCAPPECCARPREGITFLML